jgi:hypothetical protein
LQAASEWTEFDGKYLGCPYWSKRAIEHWNSTNTRKGLRHEHAVPKILVARLLLKLQNTTEEAVGRLLRSLLVAVIVTAEEDQRLNKKYRCSVPAAFYETLDWRLRYQECDIDVMEFKHRS